MSKIPTIALCGNPNCGKTTIFNLLTGSRHEVGNWPGVTIEKRVGQVRVDEQKINIVDLPGTYSLDVVDESVALDEKIARDYILSSDADLIVNIIDASNIERNLYLTTQIMEIGKPVVVLLNMMDVAVCNKVKIDSARLAELLGCPVIPFSARRQRDPLIVLQPIADLLQTPAALIDFELTFEAELQKCYQAMLPLVADYAESIGRKVKWLVVRLIEDTRFQLPSDLQRQVNEPLSKMRAHYQGDEDIAVANARYQKILSWIDDCVNKDGQVSRSLSSKLDRIFLNKYLGLPLFLFATYLMFVFTIKIGGAFIDFFDLSFGALLVDGPAIFLAEQGVPSWLSTLITDGVGGGIQVVSTFVPIIGCLFLFLSVLEDSGYLARGAFVMDRLMQSIGLPGKSFIPLMVGLGCTVPAIYSTRSLEYQKDRIMTVMMSPFISCGARLPVYVLFAAAFFPDNAQNLVFAIYIIGILVAVFTGLVLKHSLLAGENTPFVMELPLYHLPRLRNVLTKTWEKLRSFMLGAGKLIILVVVVLSFLNSLGTDGSFGNQNSEKSVLTNIGKSITPAFSPMGIGPDNWPATVGIFTGLFAKEVIVGTLDSIYSSQINADTDAEASFDLSSRLKQALQTIPDNLALVDDTLDDPIGIRVGDLHDERRVAEEQGVKQSIFPLLRQSFNGPLSAFAYLIFILLYTPCVSALGATLKETGRHWTLFSVVWSSFLAYSLATITYQLGQLQTNTLAACLWIGFFVLAHLAVFLGLKSYARRSRILGATAVLGSEAS